MYEYKIKFQNYDLNEYSSALYECENIMYELADDSNIAKEFRDEAFEIMTKITKLKRKIEYRIDYENLTKDDIESIKADEEYAEAKEHWRDRE